MPDIKVYVEDELYIQFLQQSDDNRKEIRKKMKEIIKEEVKENGM